MVAETKGNTGRYQSLIRVFIILLAVILFALIVYFNNYRTRSALPDQALCSSCHSMQANVLTWQVTSHNKVGCSNCHDDVSLTNIVFKELSGASKTPIQKQGPVSDKMCIECHNQDRIVTGPGDLLIPHRLHMEKQISCAQCHDNVTHGKVGQEILLASGKSPKDLTKKEAQDLTAIGNRIPMRVCMDCHNGKKASDSCSACHSNKAVPNTHTQDFTQFAHNGSALKELTACVKCHEYDVKKQSDYKPSQNSLDFKREYIRSNDFCQTCHSTRPITHDINFIITHPQQVKDSNSCLVCHNRKPGELKQEAAKGVYCDTCHNNDSVHAANWIKQHPIDLENTNECFSCHNANSCRNCHDERGIKR